MRGSRPLNAYPCHLITQLPGRPVCYGDPELDVAEKDVLEPIAFEASSGSQWRNFEKSKAKSPAVVLLGASAIVAIVIMIMSKRYSRSSK